MKHSELQPVWRRQPHSTRSKSLQSPLLPAVTLTLNFSKSSLTTSVCQNTLKFFCPAISNLHERIIRYLKFKILIIKTRDEVHKEVHFQTGKRKRREILMCTEMPPQISAGCVCSSALGSILKLMVIIIAVMLRELGRCSGAEAV